MDLEIKEKFIKLWKKYFKGYELPITFYYTNNPEGVEKAKLENAGCFICDLNDIRKGKSLFFDEKSIGCGGGKRYLGFVEELRPGFEYFLSYGIEGKMEGERYKKNPELVKQLLDNMPNFKAPARYMVFKRWDNLKENDTPEVVIFFVNADVLSGLFTLANYDVKGLNGVISPMGSGCSSIVYHPYLETNSQNPKAIIGMFDISARPCVERDILTFAVPFKRFTEMIDNMEESFLITDSWTRIKNRI